MLNKTQRMPGAEKPSRYVSNNRSFQKKRLGQKTDNDKKSDCSSYEKICRLLYCNKSHSLHFTLELISMVLRSQGLMTNKEEICGRYFEPHKFSVRGC